MVYLATWITFNMTLALVFGVLHQEGSFLLCPFYAGCRRWFKHPCRLLEDLYATSAFAWGVFAGYVIFLHGARRLKFQQMSCLEKYLSWTFLAHHKMS
jgi:hypothetical protein